MANFVDVSTDTKTIAGEPLEYPSTPNPVIFSNIVTIPPGTVTPWMVHPVQCYVYLLEGTMTVEFAVLAEVGRGAKPEADTLRVMGERRPRRSGRS